MAISEAAPIGQEAELATAGRSLKTAEAVNNGGAGSGPRPKPVNIVRMDSKANAALHDVKGLQFRPR